MFKRIYLLIGVVIFVFLGIFFKAQTIQADEGQCHLKHCLVPAPTIVMPEINTEVTSFRPAIRGLTWKTTVVKVYLDGKELTNIEQRKHEDYYASFFVVPDYDLTAGEHYLYTIAHSEKPGWYDQSKESLYIYFKVVRPPTKIPEKTVSPKEPQTEVKEEVTESVNIEKELQELYQQTNKLEIVPTTPDYSIFVKEKSTTILQQQEAAGLSDLGEILKKELIKESYKDKQKKNRFIGLVILGVILAIIALQKIIEINFRIKKDKVMDDQGELPPPPQPPKKDKLSLEDLEKVKQEILGDYSDSVGEKIDEIISTPESKIVAEEESDEQDKLI
ncbi:hypothetical protein KKF32_03885 [Patescibacteria group bacterium]|nr:hypothetical protein [Patescibacteria group bacterium]